MRPAPMISGRAVWFSKSDDHLFNLSQILGSLITASQQVFGLVLLNGR